MKALSLKVLAGSTDPFDDWFFETHGGTGKATWEDDDIPDTMYTKTKTKCKKPLL